MPVSVQTIRDLSPQLQHILGMVAINQDGWAVLEKGGKAALRKLEQLELIESYDDAIYGTGDSPIDRTPVMVKRYYVPIPVHIAWCEWCSEQVGEE